MSSNSVAVMPKPKYESWFMEGKLVPDYHYILIKDDYSDLEEKLNYYLNNTDKLKRIANNANQYIKQFTDRNKEKLISLLVMEKFFKLSNQKKSSVNFLT
jgi:spore maturation protein CgeB